MLGCFRIVFTQSFSYFIIRLKAISTTIVTDVIATNVKQFWASLNACDQEDIYGSTSGLLEYSPVAIK